MLDKLEVLNGDLLPSFDKYNLNYSVTVNEDVDKLQLELYSSDINSDIEIIGNELIYDNNKVLIIINNNETQNIYTLNVHKEKTNTVFSNDGLIAMEIKTKEEISNYIAPTIGSICFVIILSIFCLLFKKRKSIKY